MAETTSTLTVNAKNALLNQLNDLKLHEMGSKMNRIAAFNTEQEPAGDIESFTFESASAGVINKSGGDIIIEVDADQTVVDIRYFKSYDGGDTVVSRMNISPTTFPYGGRIIITQLTVTLT